MASIQYTNPCKMQIHSTSLVVLGTNNERGKWSKKSILRTASYSRLKAERANVLCTFVLQQYERRSNTVRQRNTRLRTSFTLKRNEKQ